MTYQDGPLTYNDIVKAKAAMICENADDAMIFLDAAYLLFPNSTIRELLERAKDKVTLIRHQAGIIEGMFTKKDATCP